MARESGVSRSYLYQVERGTSSPTLEVVEKLSVALDLPAWSLIGAPRMRVWEAGYEAGWLACRKAALGAMARSGNVTLAEKGCGDWGGMRDDGG